MPSASVKASLLLLAFVLAKGITMVSLPRRVSCISDFQNLAS